MKTLLILAGIVLCGLNTTASALDCNTTKKQDAPGHAIDALLHITEARYYQGALATVIGTRNASKDVKVRHLLEGMIQNFVHEADREIICTKHHIELARSLMPMTSKSEFFNGQIEGTVISAETLLDAVEMMKQQIGH